MEIDRKFDKPVFETRPLYLQIFDRLLGYIADGTWKSGSMVPNEIELARSFGVSVGTMRKALQALSDRGLLTRRQGRGTYVAQTAVDAPPLDNLRTRRMDPLQWQSSSVSLSTGEADAEEEVQLALTPSAAVFRLRRSWRDAATGTLLLEDCRYAAKRFPGLDADAEAHRLPLASLARRYNILPTPSLEQIELRQADARIAKQLGCETGTALLKLTRTVLCFDGIPIEFRIAHCMLGEGALYTNHIK